MKNNTYLAVNLKVKMFRDSRLKLGKDYIGVLCHDVPDDSICSNDDHFTFIETYPMSVRKRNPQVFDGEFITVTRRSDGTYRINFKSFQINKDFDVAAFASGVASEIKKALKGLIGK
jgi:hypothetical protein